MKNRRITILRFLTLTALSLIGLQLGLTRDRRACAVAPTLAPQAKLTASEAAQADLFGASVRSGTSWSQQAKLTAGDAALGNQFGSGVAIEGDLAVIASPFSDNPDAGIDVGAVYVFARSGTSWKQEAKLSPAVSEENGFFSLNSVAISGNTVAIGAQADDTSAGADAGEVTVFVRLAVGNWKREATLVAGDAAATASAMRWLSAATGLWSARFLTTPPPVPTRVRPMSSRLRRPLCPGDPYADAVGSGATLTINPANAVGAPNGNTATTTRGTEARGKESEKSLLYLTYPRDPSALRGCSFCTHILKSGLVFTSRPTPGPTRGRRPRRRVWGRAERPTRS